MKIFHIAWKDLTLAYRRLFLVGMALIAPMLMAFIFSSAFGGSGEFEINRIDLGIVNLDTPSYGFSAGKLVVDFLRSEDLNDLLNAAEYPTEPAALEALRAQDIQVAVIIPMDLSKSVTGEQSESSELRILHDPALTLAPQIVASILEQMTGGFSGAKITSDLTAFELQDRGLDLDYPLIQQAIAQITNLSQQNTEGEYYRIVHPEREEEAQVSLQQQIVGGVMASMMIFFTFFTGAYGASTILDEEADGTFQRNITSPIRLSTILGGKSVGIIFILLVQMLVLLTLSALVFGINWGHPIKILIAILATTAASTGLGMFLISLCKNRNQTGIVFGGVLTVLGMGGGLFTAGIENLPSFMNIIESLTPQGWSSRIWDLVQKDAPYLEILPAAAILLGISLVLFFIGVVIFRQRFSK
jgi:ABC-2 type transport system permease protein